MVELSVFEQRFGNSRSLGARTEHRVRGQRTARSHTMVRIFALLLIVALAVGCSYVQMQPKGNEAPPAPAARACPRRSIKGTPIDTR